MRKLILCSVIALAVMSFFALMPNAQATYGDTTTFASQVYWGDGQNARDAYLDFPEGLTRDNAGNFYIADTYNNTIRKIDTNNRMHTHAGNGSYGDQDGTGTGAYFAQPTGITVDHNGYVYVADTNNHKIKKIAPNRQVTTIVDSGLYFPSALWVDGSTLYICDAGHGAVKTVSTNGGTPATFKAGFSSPKGIMVSGDWVYVSDTGHDKVVKVHKGSKDQYNIATGLNDPNGLAKYGNDLYISDDLNDAVKKVNLSTLDMTEFASDTTMTSVNFPHGIWVVNDYVYVLNTGIGTLQRFNRHTGETEIPQDRIAGADRFGYRNASNGGATILGRPYVMTKHSNTIYLGENNKIRTLNVDTGASTFLIGNSVDNYKESSGGDARFSTIQGLDVSQDGSWLYVVDRFNNRIRKVNISSATSSWISGVGQTNTTGPTNGYKEGAADQAKFNNPTGGVLSKDGNYFYVADTGNNRIRKVRLSDGYTWLVAGNGQAGFKDGNGGDAKFNKPVGLALDKGSGRYLYVADTNNQRIREIDLNNNKVKTVAGSGQAGFKDGVGSAAYFSYPEYVAAANDGKLYVSEAGGQKIRWIDPASGDTRLVSGSGVRGYKDGSRFNAQFNNPKGIITDVDKNRIFVADSWNDVIRRVTVQKNTAPFSDPPPTVSACDPHIKIGDASLTNTFIKVKGKDFQHGATTHFNNIKATTYVTNDKEMVAKIPFGSMQLGWYNVKVENQDTQESSKYKCFGVADVNGNVPDVFPGGTASGGPSWEPAAKGFSFYAYPSSLRGGWFVSGGNVSGGDAAEIVAGTAPGLGPQVMIYDKTGKLLANFFVYAKHLRGGVRVAVGNVLPGAYDEIVVISGAGGRPHVRIFDGQGNLKHPGFFALDGRFKGGAWLAVGNVDGTGEDEIIVSAAKGGGPHVTIHKADGSIVGNFMAYESSFRGGVKVAAVDIEGDGVSEIVTVPEFGARPAKVFTRSGQLISQFYPFGSAFAGGMSVAGGNTDRKLGEEIILGAGPGGGPLVRAVNSNGDSITPNFWMYRSDFRGGVNVAAADVDDNGVDEILGAPASAGAPNYRIINPNDL
ncbi:SMP-30/gluconolactonase/LRE family protein [Patescibacteria group bacterium]